MVGDPEVGHTLAASSMVEMEFPKPTGPIRRLLLVPLLDAYDLLRNATRMSSSLQVRVLSGVTDRQVRSRRIPSSTHNEINQIADSLENAIWLLRQDSNLQAFR
jgi:hypothetical protein